MKGFFITGTDTGSGKTYFTKALAELMLKNNMHVNLLKPVESGCKKSNGNLIPQDATIYSSVIGKDIKEICKFRFSKPSSPNWAALSSNTDLDLKEIINFTKQKITKNSDKINIIEGCGGFLSPIAKNSLNADFAKLLGLPIILIINDKLGCINHTLLTIKAINDYGLKLKCLVLNQIEVNKDIDTMSELSIFTDAPRYKMLPQDNLDNSFIEFLKNA